MGASTGPVTELLNAAAAGDRSSAEELLIVVYEELRRLARASRRRARPGDSVVATELVHEAYLRLFGRQDLTWSSRGHFFAAAAQAMRNVVVEQARRKNSLKRGGGCTRVTLDEHLAAIVPASDDVLVVDEILGRLERGNPRQARVILLHCFSGLTLEETAAAMDLSLATVEREWRFARALLRSQLEARRS